MTEDNFEEFLKKAAQSYNAPPAVTPREDMWSAIQAQRARWTRVVYGGGSAVRESSGGDRLDDLAGRSGRAVLFLATGVGIGRWDGNHRLLRARFATTNLPKAGSNPSSSSEPSTGRSPDGSAGEIESCGWIANAESSLDSRGLARARRRSERTGLPVATQRAVGPD